MSFGSFEFHNPWVLAAVVPALALIYWRRRRRKNAAAIVFPSIARLRGLRPTLRQRLQWLVPFFQSIAVIALIAAAARPRRGDARTVIQNEGIAIEMVLDRSSSMQNKMVYRGREQHKIDIVKDVFVRFIQGDDKLPGRKTDLVGLTTFARFTEESCPLVTLHEPLITTVKNLRTVAPALDKYDQPVMELPDDPAKQRQMAIQMGLKNNPLNATAIGAGIKRAVLSLITAEEDLARSKDAGSYKIKGKVIILLTDGENNRPPDPVETARYAAANNIRIYYVVLQEPVQSQMTIFGRRITQQIDPDTILENPRKVVAETKGEAFLASSGDELLKIYRQIDKLERSKIGKIEFMSYQEKYRIFLIPGIAAAILALFLGETVFRSIP